jgi:hypothetical protein
MSQRVNDNAIDFFEINEDITLSFAPRSGRLSHSAFERVRPHDVIATKLSRPRPTQGFSFGLDYLM